MMTRKKSLIALSLVAALGATACSDDGDEVVQIQAAFVAPFSGPAQTTGEEVRNAAEMALEKARTNGSEVASRFSFRFIDSQSDPTVALEEYQTAIDDPAVQLGFFNWHSDVALALSGAAAESGFPHLFALGASGDLNTKFEPERAKYEGIWIKGWPTPELLSKNYITALDAAVTQGSFTEGTKTAVVYGEDTSWGRTFSAAIKSQLEAAGWTIAEEILVPPDAIDLTAEVMTAVAANPELIAGTIANSTVYSWIQQLKSGFNGAARQPLIIADGLGWNGDWYDTLGADSDGVVDQIPQFASADAKLFAKAYEDRYGAAPSPSAAGLAYDYTAFMMLVLEAAVSDSGDVTRESVRKPMIDLVISGQLTYSEGILMEEYRYSSDSWPDPVVGGDAFTFPVMQYASGESVVVFPAAIAGDNSIQE